MNPTIIALADRAYCALIRRCNSLKDSGRKLSLTSYDEIYFIKAPSQSPTGTIEHIKEYGVLVPVAEAVG